MLADYVTLDQGTGIVHTAPGHGVEDFQTGQKYGIETYAPIDDQGRYLKACRNTKAKTVFEANPIVVKLLRDRGALLGERNFQHSYPHCWRCHNPVIFRATEQWFIEHGCSRRSGATRNVPAASAGGNRQREVDAGVGRRSACTR